MSTPTLQPHITASTFGDGKGVISIGDQVYPIEVADEDAARSAVLDLVRQHAQQSGGPVVLHVTDPDGSAVLEVPSEGPPRVLSAPGPAPASSAAGSVPVQPQSPTSRLGQHDRAVIQPLARSTPALPSAATVEDWRSGRPQRRPNTAEMGWQATARKATGGMWSPPPGAAELEHRRDVQRIQRSLDGPRTIVIANPKGGVTKSTQTLMLAGTLGMVRGGSVLAWDNNENKGTLGARAMTNPAQTNTAVDLLHDLDRFGTTSARVGDLDNYVRAQGDAHFDVLVSTDDPTRTEALTGLEYEQLHQFLSRFYRLIVVDTGNSVIAENWQAAIASADQLVVPVSLSEDSAEHASFMLDHLVSTGHGQLVAESVTVLVQADTGPAAPTASVARGRAKAMPKRVHEHFGARTRIVCEVPADPSLGGGREVEHELLSRATRVAWRRVAAAVADGL